MDPDLKEIIFYACIGLSLPFLAIIFYTIFRSSKYEDRSDHGMD